MRPCPACQGRRWLIVSIDGNDQHLRIERCDLCSARTLTDADVQADPAANDALREARQAAAVTLAVATSRYLKGQQP